MSPKDKRAYVIVYSSGQNLDRIWNQEVASGTGLSHVTQLDPPAGASAS